VLLRGDGLLGQREQARQRLLLLAVQVSSILDVLDGQNNLKTVDFSYEFGNGAVAAVTDFGAYDFSHAGQHYASLLDGQAAATQVVTTDQARRASEPSVFTPCSLGGCQDRLYALRTRSPVISVSDERTSQSSGAYHARDLYAVEFSTVGMLWDASRFSGRWLSGVEFVPVFGYATYRQGPVHGHGPSLRLAAAVPETEFSLGIYARWLSYDVDGQRTRKPSFGVRAETGFSSYLTFYVTGGIDYGVSTSGALIRGRMWGGGVRLGAPLTRLDLAKAIGEATN